MNRRALLALWGIAALSPGLALGQTPGRMYRIAFVVGSIVGGPARAVDPEFRERLAKHGYVEGKNVESRYFSAPDSTPEGITVAAREAIAWNPDVIRVGLTKYTRAVAALTSTIPIVFSQLNDPVASGLVASLARPGGNLTGGAIMQAELTSKRLELVRELLPRAKRVALIVDSEGAPLTAGDAKTIRANARRLGLTVEEFDSAPDPRHFIGALEKIAKARPDAVVPVISALDARDDAALGAREGPRAPPGELMANFQRVHRIPVISFTPTVVERGVLAGLGGTLKEVLQIAADQTAKILSGKPVREIPVEQLTRIEVGINLKAAKELGIRVPESVLVRADKIVE
jgi:putative ABC transport system substrate-binding protein